MDVQVPKFVSTVLGKKTMTQADLVKSAEETLLFEERAGIAAREKFAEWRRIEAEERPRQILYWAIAGGVIIAVVILALMRGLP
jgi:hypothetical protein